jgi:hypothetical protein
MTGAVWVSPAALRESQTGFRIQREADVAQLVEQSIRNRQVIGSSPIVGSILSITYSHPHCTLSSL